MYDLMASIILCVQAAPAFYGVLRRVGARQGGLLIIILYCYALCIEYIALTTGFPYGSFVYTGPAGFKLFDILPLTVGCAWIPLVIGAHAASRSLLIDHPTHWSRPLIRIVIATLILVATDLVLDPGAVAVGLWHYADTVGLYGVPWSNFMGWFLTGSIGLLLYDLLSRHTRWSETSKHDLWLLMSSWIASIVIWTIVNIIYAQWISAIIGGILLALIATRAQSHLRRNTTK